MMIEGGKNDSTIRRLQERAKKGNFESTFQLYNYYLNGKLVNKDANKAEHYLDLAFNLFKKQKLKITQLELENFKAIKDIKIERFDKSLTLIIGSNGAGKTTILDALSLNLSWLKNRIVNSGGSGISIEPLDINLDQDAKHSSILTKFNFNSKLDAQMELIGKHEGAITNKKSSIVEVTKMGSMYKHANQKDPEFNMPLLAYYNVNRATDISSKDMSSFDETANKEQVEKFDGYHDSLNGRADFKQFFRWFKRIDDIDKHRKIKKSNISYNEFLDYLPAKIDAKTKKYLTEAFLKESQESQESPILNIHKIRDAFNELIRVFMDGFNNLEIQIEPFLTITIEKNSQKLNVLQLSQGEKSLLALILDIGRRLVLLNPSLKNPLDGEGVVLIDEIDLHLHPAWQKKIIIGLPKAFKNCQFIVSTHSPQIIGEVKPSQVIILYSDSNNSIKYYQPKQSLGLTCNEILDELMSNNITDIKLNRNYAVEKELELINVLISESDFELAKQKIALLENNLNGDIPELVKAKIDIELAGWDD
jgi:predicted ATP-binding protein involved in virulence